MRGITRKVRTTNPQGIARMALVQCPPVASPRHHHSGALLAASDPAPPFCCQNGRERNIIVADPRINKVAKLAPRLSESCQNLISLISPSVGRLIYGTKQGYRGNFALKLSTRCVSRNPYGISSICARPTFDPRPSTTTVLNLTPGSIPHHQPKSWPPVSQVPLCTLPRINTLQHIVRIYAMGGIQWGKRRMGGGRGKKSQDRERNAEWDILEDSKDHNR